MPSELSMLQTVLAKGKGERGKEIMGRGCGEGGGPTRNGREELGMAGDRKRAGVEASEAEAEAPPLIRG